AAMKAGGLNGSSEAKPAAKTEAPKSKPESSATPATPAAKTNGHTNGHGKNGNGSTPKAAGNGSSFYSAKLLERAGVLTKSEAAGPNVRSEQFAQFQIDAPACDNCGAITVRNGNCYLCHNCGNSMGCS